MNAEIFAEWLRRQGYNVVKTHSSFWYEAGVRVYQAFPFHWIIEPSQSELDTLISRQHAIGLRYSTPIASNYGCISYHAIFNKPSFSIDELDRRSRQNVRTGLKNCCVERIPIGRLAEEGWDLENDTAKRQNRDLQINREKWHQKYQSAINLPGFEAWGALVGDRLVASIFAFQIEDTIELISQQCHGDFMKARVNNALAFKVTQAMVRRPGIKMVFYTLQSLDAPTRVDEFKFRLGYIPLPVRQRVVFHPWVSPVVNRFTGAALKGLHKRYPDKPFFSKAEGLVRFYLFGNMSAKDQEWPECLIERKEEMLRKLDSHKRTIEFEIET